MAVKEHHVILFIRGAVQFKYGKLIEEMKNDVIGKRTCFPRPLWRPVMNFLNEETNWW